MRTKRYHKYCLALVLMVIAIVLGDFYKFLYASPFRFNTYPILPFYVSPSYVRGTNRYCHSMEGIFEMGEYSEECEKTESWVEKSHEIDSLCIYSVLQYAWKTDSLLMEVSLDDGCKRWLLASPASTPKYRCRLQEVKEPCDENLLSYFNVKLEDNAWDRFLRHFDVNTAYIIYLSLSIIYHSLFIMTFVLNIICVILLAKYYDEITFKESFLVKIIDICIPIIPSVVWICIRIMTYSVLH